MFLTNGLRSDPRVEKEAAALTGAGYSVCVLAWDREGTLPRTEQRGGLHIERFGPAGGHGRGARNVPGYLSFWWAAARRSAELQPRALHCHDLDTAPAGMLARRRTPRKQRTRLVLDFHELYRESNMIPRGVVGRLVSPVVALVERCAVPTSDAVLVANPGSMDAYRCYEGTSDFRVIENAPDAKRFSSEGPARRTASDPMTVGFMGQKRYVEGLLDLIEVVQRDERLCALLAGGGVRAHEVEAAAVGKERVEVSGRFSYDDLPALYGRCDVVHAVYDTGLGNVRTLFPVKVMEAMASALPVIVGSGTWIAGYVEEHGIGLPVERGPEALQGALETLLDDPRAAREMGMRGRALIEAGLNWETVSKRLVDAYAELLNEG
jgi:glycosyltransferase involved in cell wall biosynthesis